MWNELLDRGKDVAFKTLSFGTSSWSNSDGLGFAGENMGT